jgi:glycosyltransferase involved in cell wall biosynthesis
VESFGPLFDPVWYLGKNPDVAAAGIDPLTHYREYGIAEGRDPNPLFDTNWYLAQNPDVARVGGSLLDHYVLSGAAEGLDPHPLFDTDWYLAHNSDVAKAGVNPLAHFLTFGAREGRPPHPSFERDWSLAEDMDLQPVLPSPSRVARRSAPLVSVVVPVFNKAPFLRDCLSSILIQSLMDIEVICVDDASTDGSSAILAEAAGRDQRVFVVRNVVNSGAGRSRNVGIHLATGKFIQFTDADDILPREALQELHELATADRVPLVRGTLKSFRGTPYNGSLDESNEYGQICRDKRKVRFSEEPALWVPWWHTSYLIDASLLREARACYPDLRNGEDAVFIAVLLAEAETVSTTAKTTYLRRFPEARRRTRLTDAVDFVRHAAMVRRSYLDHCPQAWRDGYRPFLLGRVDQFFLKPDIMSEVERDLIKLAMMQAGIGAYLPVAARPPRWRRE